MCIYDSYAPNSCQGRPISSIIRVHTLVLQYRVHIVPRLLQPRGPRFALGLVMRLLLPSSVPFENVGVTDDSISTKY